MSISEQVSTLRSLAGLQNKQHHERIINRAADTIEFLSAKLTDIERSAEDCGSGWIPCEDRLPKEDGFYLATLDGQIVGEDKPFSGTAEFKDGKWVDDEEDYQCVLAWQPLPEPYHEP